MIREIKESDLFREFLVSGVAMLQQANIVSQNQKQTRKLDESNRKVQYCILLYCEICENTLFYVHAFIVQASPPITGVLDTFLEMQMLLPSHTLLSSYSFTRRRTNDKIPSRQELQHERDHTTPVSTRNTTEHVDYHDQTALQRVYTILVQYLAKLYYLLVNMLMTLFSRDAIHSSNARLSRERKRHSPLFNSLLCLVNEATRTTIPELWLTSESTQLALLGVCGGSIDSLLWKVY